MRSPPSRRQTVAFGLASAFVSAPGARLLAAPNPSVSFATLDQNSEPLRSQFNRDAGKVRLLFLVDPVCPTCLRGLADIERDLLATAPKDARLRTYVVHEPVIGGRASDIAGAATLLHSPAQHYWSADGSFGGVVSNAFGFRHGSKFVYAWDVWMAYGPEARWTDRAPPAPQVLMHQLGALEANQRVARLDSHAFASQARALLARAV